MVAYLLFFSFALEFEDVCLCYRFGGGVAIVLAYPCAAFALVAEGEWIQLFDGKTLEGWEKVGRHESVWEVQNGAINGAGPALMLVYVKEPYKNFRYRAEIKINVG